MKTSIIYNGLTQISVFLNYITGGPPGYSLCARFYRNWLYEERCFGPWYHVVKILDTVAGQPGHCREAWFKRNAK